jgi:hypothetical protein
MKIDRLGQTPEIPQNNDPNQLPGKVNENAEGIGKTPDSVEQFEQNTNPFDKESVFHNQEHHPQGRPFTDASFKPEHAQGLPFRDKIVTEDPVGNGEEELPAVQDSEETAPPSDLPEEEEV